MECSNHKTKTITWILQSSPTVNRTEGLQLSRVNLGEILWEMLRRYSTQASPNYVRIKQHICLPVIISFQVSLDPPFTNRAVATWSLYSIHKKRCLSHSLHWAVLQGLISSRQVNKCPGFYAALRFIAVFTRDRRWIPSWARWNYGSTRLLQYVLYYIVLYCISTKGDW